MRPASSASAGRKAVPWQLAGRVSRDNRGEGRGKKPKEKPTKSEELKVKSEDWVVKVGRREERENVGEWIEIMPVRPWGEREVLKLMQEMTTEAWGSE